MTETAAKATFLTQEAYDRLKAELAELTGPARTEIAKKIDYHAAKEEQGKMEARIRQLQQLLDTAIIGETPPDDGIVEPGMVVTVEMFGDEETFLLGSREISDDSIQVFSEQSPIGAAVNGHSVGETVTYATPSGKDVQVKILKTKPYSG